MSTHPEAPPDNNDNSLEATNEGLRLIEEGLAEVAALIDAAHSELRAHRLRTPPAEEALVMIAAALRNAAESSRNASLRAPTPAATVQKGGAE